MTASNLPEKINSLIATLSSEDAVYAQLINHQELFRRSEAYLEKKDHEIAFIGSVGKGKTTSICHLLELIDDGKPVLSTGSGRTTLCEVHLKKGDVAAIEVVPYTDKELGDYLEDFVLWLMSEDEHPEQEGFKLSAEIERALRNMLDLKVERKKVNGKVEKTDYAKVFASDFVSKEELVREFEKRIRPETRCQTRFEKEPDLDELKWFSQTFKLINSATHPNVGLSKKITLYIPSFKINDPDLSITIVDTKGVDQTVNRIDLDRCLTDERTLSVFCSTFNDAPDQTCSKLIDTSINAGLKTRIHAETLLLVLDREGEAENVLDDVDAVGDKEAGRDIKQGQIISELSQKFAVRDLDIEFFDALQEQPDNLLEILVSKIKFLRRQHEIRLEEITQSVLEIERELKTKSAKQAQYQVKMTLDPWLKKLQSCTPTLSEFFLPLIDAISSRGTYAASVRASVSRYGDWHNLDYYQEIAVGARSQCVAKIFPLKDELNVLIDNMLSQDDLQPAYSLLKQLKNTTDIRLESIAELALTRGRSIYENDLKSDSSFWMSARQQWGLGTGYKDRIAEQTHHWFKEHNYSGYEFEVTRALVTDWEFYKKEIDKLLGGNS